MQPPAHASKLLWHTHTPALHVPLPQVQPHEPQFFGSIRTSVQTPAHASWLRSGPHGCATEATLPAATTF